MLFVYELVEVEKVIHLDDVFDTIDVVARLIVLLLFDEVEVDEWHDEVLIEADDAYIMLEAVQLDDDDDLDLCLTVVGPLE